MRGYITSECEGLAWTNTESLETKEGLNFPYQNEKEEASVVRAVCKVQAYTIRLMVEI